MKPTEEYIMKTMDELGIPDFESSEDCAKRQRAMSLELNDVSGEDSFRLRTCDGVCDMKDCRDACHFGSRIVRFRLIPQAYSLFAEHSPVLHAVSVVNPDWASAEGALSTFHVRTAHQWAYRRLAQLGPDTLAAGSFERAKNVELDGSAYWSGELPMIVAGPSRKDLKSVLAIPKDPRHPKPLLIKSVPDLGRQLGYALKRYPVRRIAYIDGQGRQNRRKLPLLGDQQMEHDSWLASIPLGSRLFLFGCKRNGTRLVRV